MHKRAMQDVYSMPLQGREDPPRQRGLTMVIDMGSGIDSTRELISYAGRYIDIFKISSGSAALYTETVLQEKIHLLKKGAIEVEAGGSHFEVAYRQGRFGDYIEKLVDLQFDLIEIADGHLPLKEEERLKAIKIAKESGLKVVTEVGKKIPQQNIKGLELIQQIQNDLLAGADYVVIEGKASGKDVGIFHEDGSVIQEELEAILQGIQQQNQLIWEAPLREQQMDLIGKLGPNVNLGNIFPQEVYPLELMRNGLMLQPLIQAYQSKGGGDRKEKKGMDL